MTLKGTHEEINFKRQKSLHAIKPHPIRSEVAASCNCCLGSHLKYKNFDKRKNSLAKYYLQLNLSMWVENKPFSQHVNQQMLTIVFKKTRKFNVRQASILTLLASSWGMVKVNCLKKAMLASMWNIHGNWHTYITHRLTYQLKFWIEEKSCW